MNRVNMTSLQRVLTTLEHKEPDRVPFFLLATMHGAKELGLSIREYFSRAENIVEGQMRMLAKYRHDCVYNFFYAPIIGVVVSPFSLPVMQMGFDSYIELMYQRRKLFDYLIKVNEEFCAAWANAQLEAGATAIAYFDPVSSVSIIPRELYLETGFKSAKRMLARIKGPTVMHMASGRCLPIIDDLYRTGTSVIGTSIEEDLAEMKAACQGKLTVLGNLNGIEMRRWTPKQAEAAVKDAIAKAGRGGGFILADNHGEIPWQVPDEVLMALSEAIHQWGRYPLDWKKTYDK